jgi:hypothetical protein
MLVSGKSAGSVPTFFSNRDCANGRSGFRIVPETRYHPLQAALIRGAPVQ